MKITPHRPMIAWAFLLALLGSCGAARAWAAAHAVDELRPADPQGQVEISSVSGRIEVIGWDRPEVQVSGTLGADTDRLDISSAGGRTTIRVVPADSEGRHWSLGTHSMRDAFLTVHVPRTGAVSASLVRAELAVRDVLGDQELQSVSGQITSAAAHDVRIHTVSGDVRLIAGADAGLLEIGTVSGDVDVTGGHGDVSVNTVSGGARLALGTVTHARFKSISGDYHIRASLAADGVLEAQSVSGDIDIDFTGGEPAAEFELHSFSGDLKACFGPKQTHENYGLGSRLSFREGAGGARVRIDTQSGDVSLCAQRS
jgi:hypothetical protein